ncbi:glycosyltransferase family protein [Brevibacillus borstelensis]|uniref:glycosyltransferase family protein n=1 Tax=Brevibacillus borstelensis TaxID=45462 RepID=UPI002E1DB1CB|nr:glycosyltransferase family protein [Brevibacillus borstelensis]
MRNVAIIQARMGSTRLPGKVLKTLVDKSVLAHVVDRAQAIDGIDEVVVATTTNAEDDAIVEETKRLGAAFYRGSETDVLARYYEAARAYQADVVMRITSDCPLLDPEVSGLVLRNFHAEDTFDYVSNTLERSYPRGLDTEVFTFDALTTAFMEAKEYHQREHVTPYLYENSLRFHCKSVRSETDYSRYRWTLDTPEDWELIVRMYEHLYEPDKLFAWKDSLALMERYPELATINEHILQKSK